MDLTHHQTYVPVGLSYVSVCRSGCRVELVCRIRPLEREGSIPVDDRRRLGGLVNLGDDSRHIACRWAWP